MKEKISELELLWPNKPTGPFVEMNGGPIFDPGYPIIDANVLFDANGKVYMYYSRCCYKNPVQSEVADWARKNGLVYGSRGELGLWN